MRRCGKLNLKFGIFLLRTFFPFPFICFSGYRFLPWAIVRQTNYLCLIKKIITFLYPLVEFLPRFLLQFLRSPSVSFPYVSPFFFPGFWKSSLCFRVKFLSGQERSVCTTSQGNPPLFFFFFFFFFSFFFFLLFFFFFFHPPTSPSHRVSKRVCVTFFFPF